MQVLHTHAQFNTRGLPSLPQDEGPREIISFIKPNITIQFVDHFNAYPRAQIPMAVSARQRGARQRSGKCMRGTQATCAMRQRRAPQSPPRARTCTRAPAHARAPQVGQSMQFARDGSYFPILYFNDFWLLRDKLVYMNESLASVTLHFELGQIGSMW